MNKFYFMGYTLLSLVMNQKTYAADSGDCGPNCWYTYSNGTLTYSVKDKNDSTPAVINRSNARFNLSGSVDNVTVNEGIQKIDFDGYYYTFETASAKGKLTLPKTLSDLDIFSWRSSFSTIEINSDNLNLKRGIMTFYDTQNNPTIILSANSNVTFSDGWCVDSRGSGNNCSLPPKINIMCKGNPDMCKAKFGTSINPNKLEADYYAEYDGNKNLLLKYDDTGYNKYDKEGNVIERWNLDNTEQYDSKGHIIGQYDNKGHLLKKYVYSSDNSVSIYDSNGKLIGLHGKRILSVDEATALVSGKNTFSLKYR